MDTAVEKQTLDEVAVGIDFGNNFCRVAYYQDKQLYDIHSSEGHTSMPTVHMHTHPQGQTGLKSL